MIVRETTRAAMIARSDQTNFTHVVTIAFIFYNYIIHVYVNVRSFVYSVGYPKQSIALLYIYLFVYFSNTAVL